MNEVTLYLGDSREVLTTLPDNSVDSIVCDPPYELTQANRQKPAPHNPDSPFSRHRMGVNGDTKPVKGFMGKEWDGTGISFDPLFWAECLRVIKDGGHLLAFGGTRTSHRMAVAIEDAGFEIRDTIMWMYGSGFPKSHNIGKAIDREVGAEPTVVGTWKPTGTARIKGNGNSGHGYDHGELQEELPVTVPTSAEAQAWQGWGTALKPAYEPIIMARKPLKKGNTIAKNVLEFGTGAINIDGTRVQYQNDNDKASATPQGKTTSKEISAIGAEPDVGRNMARVEFPRPEQRGRWPANVILSHNEDCKQTGVRTEDGYTINRFDNGAKPFGNASGESYTSVQTEAQEVPIFECTEDCPIRLLDESTPPTKSGKSKTNHGAYDGESTTNFIRGNSGPHNQYNDVGGPSRFFKVLENEGCTDDCPVRILDEQSGITKSTGGQASLGAFRNGDVYGKGKDIREKRDAGFGDVGGASRFFYTSKTSKKERNLGLPEGAVNTHPTVKPIQLMRYLVRLVTPPNGTVLDPFTGSGSTGCAAILEGFNFIGIELEEESYEIARQRIDYYFGEQQRRNAE